MESKKTSGLKECPKGYGLWVMIIGILVAGFFIYLGFIRIMGVPDLGSTAIATTTTTTSVIPDVSISAGSSGAAITLTSGETVASSNAFLGIEIMSVDDVIADQLDLPGTYGVLINNVMPQGPADDAGLKRGDVIIYLGDSSVKDTAAFVAIMAKLSPGDIVRIVFIRNGKKGSAYAELIERPGTAEVLETSEYKSSDLGITIVTIDASYRSELGLPAAVTGVLVLSVENGSIADAAGLEAGTVITAIDKINITGIDDFLKIMKSNEDDELLLDIINSGGVSYLPLDLTVKTSAAPGNMPLDKVPVTPGQSTLGQRITWLLTGGSPWTEEDDSEEEEGGYKGQPVELPPKGSYDPTAAETTLQSNVVLTEHIEEEDDYEKPICKRLEEEGERYETEETVSGII
ncbi:MAG: PDZ domain-containing protein [Candidatus Omnitrophica bacterium]|nr:PDZ domain-containing protein [Candidatus Omnitrophota bacterium]